VTRCGDGRRGEKMGRESKFAAGSRRPR